MQQLSFHSRLLSLKGPPYTHDKGSLSLDQVQRSLNVHHESTANLACLLPDMHIYSFPNVYAISSRTALSFFIQAYILSTVCAGCRCPIKFPPASSVENCGPTAIHSLSLVPK